MYKYKIIIIIFVLLAISNIIYPEKDINHDANISALILPFCNYETNSWTDDISESFNTNIENTLSHLSNTLIISIPKFKQFLEQTNKIKSNSKFKKVLRQLYPDYFFDYIVIGKYKIEDTKIHLQLLFWDINKNKYSKEYSFNISHQKDNLDSLLAFTVISLMKVLNPNAEFSYGYDYAIKLEKIRNLYKKSKIEDIIEAAKIGNELLKKYKKGTNLTSIIAKIYAKIGIYWKANDLSQSEHYLSLAYSYAKAVLKIDNNNSDANLSLSFIYRVRGIFDKSIEYAMLALRENPINYENLINISELYSGVYFPLQFNYEKATKFLQAAKNIDKNDIRIVLTEGNIQVKKGNYKEALFNFLEVITRDSSLAQGYNNLGALYYQEGNFCKSEEMFFRALTLEEQNIHILINLALCYEANNKLGFAKNMWVTIATHPAADMNITRLANEHIEYINDVI